MEFKTVQSKRLKDIVVQTTYLLLVSFHLQTKSFECLYEKYFPALFEGNSVASPPVAGTSGISRSKTVKGWEICCACARLVLNVPGPGNLRQKIYNYYDL